MTDQGSTPTADPAPSSSPSPGGSNDSNNQRPRSSLRNNQNNPRSSTPRFKGAIETVTTLGTKAERQDKDQFIRFKESLKNHVMREFKHPKDIVVVVKTLSNPDQALRNDIPKLKSMLIEFGVPYADKDNAEHADMVESVKELFKSAMSSFSKRRDQLSQNKTKLYGTIWGQCSPALQSKL